MGRVEMGRIGIDAGGMWKALCLRTGKAPGQCVVEGTRNVRCVLWIMVRRGGDLGGMCTSMVPTACGLLGQLGISHRVVPVIYA